jgi:hypothetical protein
MQLGDASAGERTERSQLDVVLDKLNDVYAELLDTIETGGLEQLNTVEKISFWQRFETFRNRLPLVDHGLIADAEASDLAGEYSFSNLARFLVRMFQLSPGEAAARVRAAAALGPRSSMLGERLEPVLSKLAAMQRDGAVTTEKVQIVERAMHKLARTGLNPADVETAAMHRCWARLICGGMRYGWSMLPIRTARNRLMISCSNSAAIWS